MLSRLKRGESSAAASMLPLVYDNLRAQAAALFRSRNQRHTLQPTALVHEAYLKLVHSDSGPLNGRSHFMAVAATAMRQVLADHARGRRRLKRGGDTPRVTISESDVVGQESPIDLVDLNDALTELAKLDERQARIVELRFLSGLNTQEIADLLDISRRTVELDWRFARAWLRRRLAEAGAP
jgi:RNA polymerase sigma factor (TIGR02999 family)